MYLRSQHIQETAHAANDILCPQGIPLPGYLFSCQTGLAITAFQIHVHIVTVRPVITDYLVLVFQYIANLLIGVLVEGLDDYGILRKTAQIRIMTHGLVCPHEFVRHAPAVRAFLFPLSR